VEEYTLNLLRGLFEKDKQNEYVLFFNSFKKTPANFNWIKKYPNVKLKQFHVPNKLLNFSFWYLGWPKIDRLLGGVEIFFMPNIIFGSVSRKTKLLLTMHDLSFERYPETFSWSRRLWHVFINSKKICRRADKIIAVSDSTKDDLVTLYNIPPKKIEVIYSGVAEKFKIISRNDSEMIKVKEKYNLPYKFILYLGTIEPRKNIKTLVVAYQILKKYAQIKKWETLEKYKLVIAGHKGWMNKKILEEISKTQKQLKNPEDIQMINFVEEADKEYVLNLASLFVYPSIFEGFGFPPLEAMKCGVPVIASNNSSLPEIVGEAGILVDSDKPGEIGASIKNILLSEKLKEELIARGIERAKIFQWKTTVHKVLKIMDKI